MENVEVVASVDNQPGSIQVSSYDQPSTVFVVPISVPFSKPL